MAEIIISEQNFEEEVLKSEIPVVLDFWATWCGPCRMLAPVVAKIAEKYETPVLETQEATSRFTSKLIQYLTDELAPRISMHGVMVDVFGEGVLILGESGVGKSETALEFQSL